jgi:hypothetical protein
MPVALVWQILFISSIITLVCGENMLLDTYPDFMFRYKSKAYGEKENI